MLKDGGTQVGWTNETISESLLDSPSAVVSRGRLGARRAELQGAVIEGDRPSAAASGRGAGTAAKLVAWAKAGPPIVLVGNWSAPTVSGLAQAGWRSKP